ncbi:hypothetical protein AHAS_Ahas07G0103000 [Arachis hypogaea]
MTRDERERDRTHAERRRRGVVSIAALPPLLSQPSPSVELAATGGVPATYSYCQMLLLLSLGHMATAVGFTGERSPNKERKKVAMECSAAIATINVTGVYNCCRHW